LVIEFTAAENEELRERVRLRQEREEAEELKTWGRVLSDQERDEVRKYGHPLSPGERMEMRLLKIEEDTRRQEQRLQRKALELERTRLATETELEKERLDLERERLENERYYNPGFYDGGIIVTPPRPGRPGRPGKPGRPGGPNRPSPLPGNVVPRDATDGASISGNSDSLASSANGKPLASESE